LLFYKQIILISETEEGLHKGLLLLENYYDKVRLAVNIKKTKIMILWFYENNSKIHVKENLEIAKFFTYLGIVFTTMDL
jgi:hypothetical protein